jgi:L-lactate dehydrogenase complex protein LldG
MSQREQILAAVKTNKPTSTPLPSMKMFESEISFNFVDKFIEMLKRIGGTAHVLNDGENINEVIKSIFPVSGMVVSNVEGIDFTTTDLNSIATPLELQNVNLAIMQGEFGVAENGAVWVNGHSITHQALPFITQHLVLVISKENIVENMHKAYERLHIHRPGYGVFIAGPSKTADIEQSLVIGAHGSRSLLVVIQ